MGLFAIVQLSYTICCGDFVRFFARLIRGPRRYVIAQTAECAREMMTELQLETCYDTMKWGDMFLDESKVHTWKSELLWQPHGMLLHTMC